MLPSDLYPYQKDGVKFLLSKDPRLSFKPHKLLGDDPGLGKTPQACVALRFLGVNQCAPALIICPAPLKLTWAKRLVEWGAVESLDDIHIVMKEKEQIPFKSVIVINYELVIAPEIAKQLAGKNARHFYVVICDEAQRLRALDSKRTKKILGRGGIMENAVHKWMLSGTIMPNRPIELFPILKTLAPECIAPHLTKDDFGMHFCNGYVDEFGGRNYQGYSHMDELRERLQPFMLRREVKDVYSQLPPAIYEDVFIDVGELEFDESTEALATVRKLVGDRKLPYAIEYIKDRLANSLDRIVIFAYSRSVVVGLSEALKCPKVFGGMSAIDKQKSIDSFTGLQSIRCLVAQINAAGEGIDGLQDVAHNIVFAELDWSAGGTDQAIGRLRRIGQTKTVRVTRLIAVDTLDESILGVYHKKKKAINQLLNTKRNVKMAETGTLERIASGIEALNANFGKLFSGSSVSIEAVKAAGGDLIPGEVITPTEPTKKSTGRPRKDAAAVHAVVEESPTVQPDPAGSAGPSDAPIATLDDLQKTALTILKTLPRDNKQGQTAIANVITTAGVTKMSDLDPDQYDDVLLGLQGILEEFALVSA
jgi:SWI/SNF-related matrix-associated actin-dependent regulator 1 of chromatin subfamily A